MTEPMIPVRNRLCQANALQPGGRGAHQPGPATVQNESNRELEWQFASCLHCARSIARFRILRGGQWFDHWGDLPESAYRFEDSGHTG